MNISKQLISIAFLSTTLISANVLAYGSDENKKCRKPKFRDFEPAKLTEVEPGSEISFHVSRWASPDHITATAKKIPMQVNVIDKMNFFVVTANLPPELKGTFARISIAARAKEGRCKGKGGWLIKIKDSGAESMPASNEESESTAD